MRSELPFDFEMPLHVFEKADAGAGKTRRIGGVASLDSDDRQQEVVLQSGLNWQDFNKNGWFNDNHSKKTVDILGYPDGPARYFRKGQALPSGEKAKANCHWVEGYLLDTPKAVEVWELGKALAKTHRRLGLSVEGKIFRRQGIGNKVIARPWCAMWLSPMPRSTRTPKWRSWPKACWPSSTPSPTNWKRP